MIRRKAQVITSAPGATPATYNPGFILGWGVDNSNQAYVIFEDATSHVVESMPLTANTFFFLDGCPDSLPQL